jgi:hypothetical protein
MAIVCDGTSDLCLQNMVEWIADTAFPEQAFRIFPAREVIPAQGALHQRLQKAYIAYEPQIIVCHRDAETMPLADRVLEISTARQTANLPISVVAAVPVRMIESWLLTDEGAIRCAADNRNGTSDLNLPSHQKIEQLSNPKAVLFSSLKAACGLPPQRLKKFNENRARSRIASFIENFEHLRTLASFQLFEHRLLEAITLLRAQQE